MARIPASAKSSSGKFCEKKITGDQSWPHTNVAASPFSGDVSRAARKHLCLVCDSAARRSQQRRRRRLAASLLRQREGHPAR
ncbi:hypothetical protein Taro_028711 [Colocasia esculenta]|uniref:Uncharacterized protein n=1 Tax=Colocasia esculenta TaxID=4460 RepID=A0A843VH41_COLES|nr:hypothetical protein [Colocasia esculenta]